MIYLSLFFKYQNRPNITRIWHLYGLNKELTIVTINPRTEEKKEIFLTEMRIRKYLPCRMKSLRHRIIQIAPLLTVTKLPWKQVRILLAYLKSYDLRKKGLRNSGIFLRGFMCLFAWVIESSEKKSFKVIYIRKNQENIGEQPKIWRGKFNRKPIGVLKVKLLLLIV